MIKNIIIFILVIMVLVLYFSSKQSVRPIIKSNINYVNKQAEEEYYKKCYQYFNFEKIPKICYQTWKTTTIEIQKLHKKKK